MASDNVKKYATCVTAFLLEKKCKKIVRQGNHHGSRIFLYDLSSYWHLKATNTPCCVALTLTCINFARI